MTEWSCDDFYCHMFDVRNSSAVWHMNCDVRTSSWILLLAPPPPCWPVVTSGSHLSPHLSSVLGCRWAFCLSANCFSCILIKNAVWSQFKVCVDLLWRHCDSVHSIRTSRCKRPSESREARTEQHVWKLQRDKPTSSRMFSITDWFTWGVWTLPRGRCLKMVSGVSDTEAGLTAEPWIIQQRRVEPFRFIRRLCGHVNCELHSRPASVSCFLCQTPSGNVVTHKVQG